MVIFHSYVSLPEGNPLCILLTAMAKTPGKSMISPAEKSRLYPHGVYTALAIQGLTSQLSRRSLVALKGLWSHKCAFHMTSENGLDMVGYPMQTTLRQATR
jgi:hypothetical protein